MNNNWSQFIQTSEELYKSRALRFRIDNKSKWLDAIGINNGMKLLDIGCGSGLLCNRIKELLPDCEVNGIDQDENHIVYAKNRSRELGIDCNFQVGNALCLPFPNNVFDACISHTVIEHVDREPFIKEQYRILKESGLIIVMFVYSGMSIYNETRDSEYTDDEKRIFEKISNRLNTYGIENNIGRQKFSGKEIPLYLEKGGFQEVNVDFIALTSYMPDNVDVDDAIAKEQIELNYVLTESNLRKVINIEPDYLTESEIAKVYRAIDRLYKKRLDEYTNSIKIWDMSVSVVMVTTGYKRK